MLPIIASEVVVRVAADVAGLRSGLKQAEGLTKQTAARLGKIGGILSASVTAPLVGFGIAAVNAASDLEESMNKVQVVFAEMGDEMVAWSKKSAQAFGLSQQEALEAAGTFGNFFRAAGLAVDQSAEMSQQLVQLAADLASFNNVDPTVALEKLRSALAGETEPLRAFGVNLNMARIEAEALSLGLVQAEVDMVKVKAATLALEKAQRQAAEALKKYGENSEEYREALVRAELAEQRLQKALAGKVPELNAAQKIQAIYSIILKDTALAQGDFARTSESLANTQRILRAEVKNLAATLGQELMPFAKEVLQGLLDLVRAFKALSPETRRTVVRLAAVAAAAGPVLAFIGMVASGISALAGLVGAIGGLGGVIAGLGGALAALTGPVGLAVAAVVGLYVAWQKNLFGIRDLLVNFATAVESLFVGVLNVLYRFGQVVVTVGKYFRVAAEEGDYLNDFLADLPGPVRLAVEPIGRFIGTLSELVATIGYFLGISNKMPKLAYDIQQAFSKLGEVVSAIGGYFRAVVEDGDYLNDFLYELPTPVRLVIEPIGRLIGTIRELGGTIAYFLGISSNMPKLAYDIQRTFQGVVSAVRSIPDRIRDILRGVWETVFTWLSNLGQSIQQAGRNLVMNLVRGIQSVATAPIEALKGILSNLRAMLPFSPAKVGPLRDLREAGIKIGEELAKGMARGQAWVARAGWEVAAASLPGVEGRGVPVPGPMAATGGLPVGPGQVVINVYNPQPRAAEEDILFQLRKLALMGVIGG